MAVLPWCTFFFPYERSIAVRVAAPWPRPGQSLACFGPSLQMPPSVSSAACEDELQGGFVMLGGQATTAEKEGGKKEEAFTGWGPKGEGGKQVVLLTRAKK